MGNIGSLTFDITGARRASVLMDGLGGKGKQVNIEEALRWVDVNCTDAATLDRVRSRRVARTLADEIDRLREELTTVMAQRIEWRCVVGGEIFTTDDTKVADTWRDDGFDVTKHVLTPNVQDNQPPHDAG